MWKWNSWERKLRSKHFRGRDGYEEFKKRNLGEKFGELNSRERKYGITKLGRH